mgnify:CR=1 FL=1|tara:strand:- start:633 stop:1388 length:756 start_codon:yes stop_codon:yes gene_type:complete
MGDDVEDIPQKRRKVYKVRVPEKDLGVTFPDKFSFGPLNVNKARREIEMWKMRIKDDYGRRQLMNYVTGARPKESVYEGKKSFKPANHSGEFVAKRIETIAEIDEKLCDAINRLCAYDHRTKEPLGAPIFGGDCYHHVSHCILEVDGRTKDKAIIVRGIVDEVLELWNDLVEEEWKDYVKMQKIYRIAKYFNEDTLSYLMGKRIQRNKNLLNEIQQCYSEHGAEEVAKKHGEFAKIIAVPYNKRSRAKSDK